MTSTLDEKCWNANRHPRFSVRLLQSKQLILCGGSWPAWLPVIFTVQINYKTDSRKQIKTTTCGENAINFSCAVAVIYGPIFASTSHQHALSPYAMAMAHIPLLWGNINTQQICICSNAMHERRNVKFLSLERSVNTKPQLTVIMFSARYTWWCPLSRVVLE